MKIDIIVTDYDRTIADENNNFMIDKRLKEFLIKLPKKKILATGRRLSDIPDKDVLKIFDVLVLENGTILFSENKKEILPDNNWFVMREKIINLLNKNGISFVLGDVIIYSDLKNYYYIEKIIKENNFLNYVNIEFNKDSFMIMPYGWNKGKGVKIAIERIGNGKIIAIGDEVNDISLFEIADFKIAVNNAVLELKRKADIVCNKNNGEGVLEVLMSIWKEEFLEYQDSIK